MDQRKLWLEKIKRDYHEIKHLPVEFKNDAFYKEAITRNRFCLKYISNPTKAMYLFGVLQGTRLNTIPPLMLNENLDEFFEAALKHNELSVFPHMPLELITLELCWKALRYSAMCFHTIPEYFQTEDMAEYACKEHPRHVLKSIFDTPQWWLKMKNKGVDVPKERREDVEKLERGEIKQDEVEEEVKKPREEFVDVKADNEALCCIVCMDSKRCTIFMPCQHIASCKLCSETLMKNGGDCPVCRSKIRAVNRVFIP